MIESAVGFLLTVVAWLLIAAGSVVALIVVGVIILWLWFLGYMVWAVFLPSTKPKEKR